MSKGREAILGSIRSALEAGRAAGWAPPVSEPPDFHEVDARNIEPGDTEALRDRFRVRLEKLGDSVRRISKGELAGQIDALMHERGLRAGVVESAVARVLGAGFPSGFSLANDKTTMFAADIALVLADYGVAETGTLVFVHVPGRSRLITVAPPLQLVVLLASTLLPDLVDVLKLMRDVDPAHQMVWVTGSSRTADIDGILVRGAHGPKELVVFLLEDV